MKLPQLSILIDSKLIEGLSLYLGLIMITLSETAFGLPTNLFGGPPGQINADSSRSADWNQTGFFKLSDKYLMRAVRCLLCIHCMGLFRSIYQGLNNFYTCTRVPPVCSFGRGLFLGLLWLIRDRFELCHCSVSFLNDTYW